MDGSPNLAQAMVNMAYVLAALASICAAVFWFRADEAKRKAESAGKTPTLEWFSPAANATGIALGTAGLAFLASQFV